MQPADLLEVAELAPFGNVYRLSERKLKIIWIDPDDSLICGQSRVMIGGLAARDHDQQHAARNLVDGDRNDRVELALRRHFLIVVQDQGGAARKPSEQIPKKAAGES